MVRADAALKTALDVDKAALRRAMKAALASLSREERERADRALSCALAPTLDALGKQRPGAVVALFASLPREVPTDALDDALRTRGIRRALPACEGDDLRFLRLADHEALRALPKDRLGIPTPLAGAPEVALGACALVFVPGLVFDEAGHRVGYGRGFYDRALRRARAQDAGPRAIGLLFDVQLSARVPAGPLDERVDALCTPDLGLVPCR